MDTSQQAAVIPRNKEVSVALLRQRRSIAEKRRIVEETLAPGASVARVARAPRDQRQSGIWLAPTLPGGETWGA